MPFKDYSTTPANNTGLFPEGMARAQLNDNLRVFQGELKEVINGLPFYEFSNAISYASESNFTVAGDARDVLRVGDRVRVFGASTGTLDGDITGITFASPNTTVIVDWEGGELKNESLRVWRWTGKYPDLKGADGTEAGRAGLAPAPVAEDAAPGQIKVLAANGGFVRPTWQFIEEVTGNGQYLTTSEDLSLYDIIRIHAFGVPSADADLILQVGSASGWLASTSHYLTRGNWLKYDKNDGGAQDVSYGDTTSSSLWLSEDSRPVESTGAGINFSGQLSNFGAVSTTLFRGHMVYEGTSSDIMSDLTLFGLVKLSVSLTRLRLGWRTSANWSSGGMVVEGRKFD